MAGPTPEPFRGETQALLVVDLQRDFLPGGALAVPLVGAGCDSTATAASPPAVPVVDNVLDPVWVQVDGWKPVVVPNHVPGK